jgi:hypothetical protein
LRKIRDKNDRIRWAQVDEFFKERRRLGFEGKIYVKPVEKNELFVEDSDSTLENLKRKGSIIKITGVTSIIAGLLPFDLRIDLKYIDYKHGKTNESTKEVRIIRDLVFLLRDSGLRRVYNYRIEFIDSKGSFLDYEDDSCVFQHSDSQIINTFIEAFSGFCYI